MATQTNVVSGANARPLRIGILGAAKIAPGALIEPAKMSTDVVIAAVAARDPARAAEFAATHGIADVYGSYDELIARPDLDAIYNALPPSRHADLTIAALRAGKHVLCEKPFAMNAGEARAMVDAATQTGKVLMEAFHYRYHPLFVAVLGKVRSGQLGNLQTIAATFVVAIPERAGELRYDPALGGGALMDLGTYCVHWCRSVAGREPTIPAASSRMAAHRVDLHTLATLDFGDGLIGTIDCGMDAPFAARLVVTGTAGTLIAENPLAPQFGHQLRLELAGAAPVSETFARSTTYSHQLQAFIDAVRNGVVPPTSGEDSVAQMATLDAIASAASRS